MKSLKVRIISCFDTKTRFADTRAFRICINKEDCDTFLDKNNWPRNIILREWVFKMKENKQSSQPATTVPANERNVSEQINI